MILKDGKIVVEYYFNDHNANKPWYWASAGKSLTSVMVACAQADGKLQLTDLSSNTWATVGPRAHLNQNRKSPFAIKSPWLPAWMTMSLIAPNLPVWNVLQTRAADGLITTVLYTLLDGVIEGATGQDLNAYLKSRLSAETGINGLYIASGYNNVFTVQQGSWPDLVCSWLGNGKWNDKDIIKNPDYVRDMSQTSQNLNKSYGYLWWLNSKVVCCPSHNLFFQARCSQMPQQTCLLPLVKWSEIVHHSQPNIVIVGWVTEVHQTIQPCPLFMMLCYGTNSIPLSKLLRLKTLKLAITRAGISISFRCYI